MNQTTATSTNTQPVDLEALRLQLKKDAENYYGSGGYCKEAHDRLLHTLQIYDYREIITAMVDGDDLANAFVVAGTLGHVDIFKAFLNHGMNVDIKNKKGWTALLSAVFYDQEERIQILLDHHVNVDAQNRIGETALMLASHHGLIKIVEMLLGKNANPNIQDENGMTALMEASEFGDNREIVQVLLDHNADTELKDNDGEKALDLAKNKEIKRMLLNHVSTSYVLK